MQNKALNENKDLLEMTVRERTQDLSKTIRELKNTRNHLVQSEKMASIGTLTSGIAHEINNPLNFIAGGIAMISNMENAPNPNTELGKQFNSAVNTLSNGLTQASEIVKTFISFSYRGTSDLLETDIHEIIDNTILFMNYKMPKDIKLIKEFHLEKKVPIFAEKIHQVLINIIDNALFELNSTVSTQKILKIKTEMIDHSAMISISYTGKKIPEEKINRLFDPFYTIKEPVQGTGKGLSICYTLIQEHNGNIIVENIENGVCFRIELPLN
jgi:two-component system, NtrC family, sensor kinase